MEKMLTTKETAEALRVTVRTVFTWIKEGKLHPVKVGRKNLIRETEVQKILRGE